MTNVLVLIVWRIHVHFWHQTKSNGLDCRASKKDVVKSALATKDPGAPMWETIPGPRFQPLEKQESGRRNSGV